MRFKGRIIDGPKEGESYEAERPYFHTHIWDRPSILDFRPGAITPVTDIKVGKYVWSRSLRAWCFVWDVA